MYVTSFYYLMNCNYPKKRFPLSIKSNGDTFSFPLNINVKEWVRQIFIIDVQKTQNNNNRSKVF